MVAIEEIQEEVTPPSQERLWDAEEIEKFVSQLKRPTAKMQIVSLVKKLKKEASALKSIESTTNTNDGVASSTPSTATTTKTNPSPVAPTPAPSPAVRAPIALPKSIGTTMSSSVTYISIDRFMFDAGGSSDKFVTLYLPLPGVGTVIKNKDEQIKCNFEKDSFDVTVLNGDVNGKNYRIKRDNLEHDIIPEKSRYIIKADKIIVKLAKIKGEYGTFDFWSKLTDPKRKEKKNNKTSSSDPTGSIMSMMKDMYDSGDDNMKKMIGETMLKQRNGELNNDKMDSGLGGMGGMGD
jgi:calcyclin binding protein